MDIPATPKTPAAARATAMLAPPAIVTLALAAATLLGAGTATAAASTGTRRDPVAATRPAATAGTTAGPTTTSGRPAAQPAHVDNPFVGTGYVNPEWKAKADAEPGGDRVSNTPTAVWLDQIRRIAGSTTSSRGSMGLAAHLDAALAQRAAYAEFVIDGLPGRDCNRLNSNGELAPEGIDRYRSEFIDPIAAIMADPRYAALRIIVVVEPNSLPNLVTSVGSRAQATPMCDTVLSNGSYVKGIQYALNKLHAIGNVYTYLDAAHHGEIGWNDDFNPTADLMASTVKGTTAGTASVDGFTTNVAGYSALREPFVAVDPDTRQSKWIDWNQFNDEATFALAFRTKLVSLGFGTGIGAAIDTSRNGWGGPKRPTKASTSSDINTRVDDSRIDRRIVKQNWCNQTGAGLGERPRANPEPGIDAYTWIKPPGESDGAGTAIPNDEGMGADRMCDPSYNMYPSSRGGKTGALANAPIFGAWFSTQFNQLMANAYPPL